MDHQNKTIHAGETGRAEESLDFKKLVGQRIKQARESLGLTQKELCQTIGMPLPSLRGYELAQRTPGGDAIASLAKLGINANWLLTGEGSPLLTPGQQIPAHTLPAYSLTEGLAYTAAEPEEHPRHLNIPPHDAVADGLSHAPIHLAPDNYLMFKEEWIRQKLGADPARLRLAHITGDTMEPTLRAGDIVLIDRTTDHPIQEGIYLVKIGDMPLVRRLQNLPGGIINVSSDNPAIPPWQLKQTDIDGTEVTIEGRIVWAGRQI